VLIKGRQMAIEAIGAASEAVTGGLIARAIEPHTGEDATGSDGFTHEHHCLNCGTALAGSYCYNCGQHAHVHRTIMALGHDILHGVFHFEGKVWRTVPMLFWKPGDLTRRYIHGERAKFVSPLALFLFSVFLMFAVFESFGGPISTDAVVNAGGTESAVSEMTRERDTLTREIVALEAKRDRLAQDNEARRAIESRVAEARSDRDGLNDALTGIAKGLGVDRDLSTRAKIDTGSKALDNQIRTALKNPKLLLYKLQSSAYKFSWALIPLSLPFMWLIFAWRRQYKLYDHAVFVTYSITFVMLLLSLMALAKLTGLQPGWGLLIIPVHFYWQLRSAYQLSVTGAVIRSSALMIISFVVMLIFAAFLLWLGVSG
jgi:hypothetical protein